MTNDLRPAWIFFDCFNTLLDDFDEAGDESGLGSILDLPVREGYFATPRGFEAAYSRWRGKPVVRRRVEGSPARRPDCSEVLSGFRKDRPKARSTART